MPERNGTLIEHGSFQPPPKVTASVVTGKAVLAGLFPKPAAGTASRGGAKTTVDIPLPSGPAAAALARQIEGEADIAGEDGA